LLFLTDAAVIAIPAAPRKDPGIPRLDAEGATMMFKKREFRQRQTTLQGAFAGRLIVALGAIAILSARCRGVS
jgi:hypothetical protein